MLPTSDRYRAVMLIVVFALDGSGRPYRCPDLQRDAAVEVKTGQRMTSIRAPGPAADSGTGRELW